MKKPSAKKKATAPAKTKPDSLTSLLTEVRQLIQSARRGGFAQVWIEAQDEGW